MTHLISATTHLPDRATLTEEEILQVTKDENFRKFLSVTSKLMEVAITEDIARGTEDYSEDLTVDDESKLMSVNNASITHDH